MMYHIFHENFTFLFHAAHIVYILALVITVIAYVLPKCVEYKILILTYNTFSVNVSLCKPPIVLPVSSGININNGI